MHGTHDTNRKYRTETPQGTTHRQTLSLLLLFGISTTGATSALECRAYPADINELAPLPPSRQMLMRD